MNRIKQVRVHDTESNLADLKLHYLNMQNWSILNYVATYIRGITHMLSSVLIGSTYPLTEYYIDRNKWKNKDSLKSAQWFRSYKETSWRWPLFLWLYHYHGLSRQTILRTKRAWFISDRSVDTSGWSWARLFKYWKLRK